MALVAQDLMEAMVTGARASGVIGMAQAVKLYIETNGEPNPAAPGLPSAFSLLPCTGAGYIAWGQPDVGGLDNFIPVALSVEFGGSIITTTIPVPASRPASWNLNAEVELVTSETIDNAMINIANAIIDYVSPEII